MTGRQYTVTEIGVEEDRVNVSIRFNGYIFSIGLSPDCFVNSPVALDRFRRFLRGLAASIRTDSQAQEENDYCDDVANVFRPDFERLAPPKVHTGKVTLADIAARGHFKCDYQVIDEKDVPGAVTARENDWPGGREGFDIREFRSLFPLFDPAEVEVELPGSGMDDIHNIIPQKIFVDGKAGFYKKCDRPYACREEVEKYYAIQASGLSTQQLRTSRLFGIVADKNGRMSGLLYDLIQTKAEGVQGTLDAAATPATPMPLREKWASQIRNTVTDLHDLGVAWGDVKADNVLIDADDNAVVIDLEGGSTDKWVDRSMGGTVAGDLQGLEKLVDFILNDNSPLRRVTGREEEEHDGREHLVLSQGVPIS